VRAEGADGIAAATTTTTPLHVAIEAGARDAIRLLVVKLVLHWKS